jgi:voltage-gated potassium channel
MLARVLVEKKEELILSIIITFFLIICASAVMYYAEHAAQPTKFKNIPQTMEWSVATLTTVGSNIYPVTTLGKILTTFISFLGIGIFALPAGILASGFTETLRKEKKPTICPHCGKVI